ncbi:hypothetical protein ILUMI_04459 [Ignelater luminosus]|uniref:Uncharacterized protein n=1 Tax=Ignelater luminosus TaxID=2038154 RepID=A0A8K0DEA9_IGNLU|nr:hypothetical protein ILUMI_04459 [Ignelater luminosus]
MSVSNVQRSITDSCLKKINLVQRKLIRWFAQRPVLTLMLIITIGIGILPAVTIVMLTPLAVTFDYVGIFASGGVSTVYSVLFKGFLLAFFVLMLLATGFLILTCVSVIHSYKLFSSFSLRKKQK